MTPDPVAGALDYQMTHRPTEDGAPAYDLLEKDANGDVRYPTDIYDNPHYYTGFRQMLGETMKQLQAVKGNPDALITVYRVQKTGGGLNTGDWITLSHAYAKTEAQDDSKGTRSIEVYKVPAKHVRFAGDDLMEWGYFGPTTSNRKK